jgi:hypothetical protein
MFYLDGSFETTTVISPYTWSWNTGTASNGTHTLMAKAYDAAGNMGSSENVTVTVENQHAIAVTQPSGGGSNGGGSVTVTPPVITTTSSSSEVSSRGATITNTTTTSSPETPSVSLLALITELRSLVIKLFASSNNGRPLTIGSEGQDVWALQVYLMIDGKGPASEKLAARGPTGTFGQMTQSALAEYQSSQGISPSSGYFGTKTREAIGVER